MKSFFFNYLAELFLSIRQPKLKLLISQLDGVSARCSARSTLPRSRGDAVRFLNTFFPKCRALPALHHSSPTDSHSARWTCKILASASLLLAKRMAPAFSLLSNSRPRDATAWEREMSGFVGVTVPIQPAITSHIVPSYCGRHALKLWCRQTQF